MWKHCCVCVYKKKLMCIGVLLKVSASFLCLGKKKKKKELCHTPAMSKNDSTFYRILFHKRPVIIAGAQPFNTLLARHYPPLMRSQIAFISCYRIVFRPRHSICFGNNGLSSSPPKLPISAYQMQGYPECCAL